MGRSCDEGGAEGVPEGGAEGGPESLEDAVYSTTAGRAAIEKRVLVSVWKA